MTIGSSLLPEFDQEMSGTRKTLERLPEAIPDWSPHPRSMPMPKLASHVAGLVRWGSLILETGGLDLRPANGPGYAETVHATREELLAAFAASRARTRAAIEAAPDAAWQAPWTLSAGSHVIFTLPRLAAYRTMMMNHVIHHRAQLQVYLRLRDIPVPGLYGPSADDR